MSSRGLSSAVAHENGSLRKFLPLGCALALYAGITGALARAAFYAASGHFVYLLDDPYITMAMAKSLALHGVWGITRFGFTSSCSSPLFLLLLAGAYRITGVHEATPAVLSLIFGALSIFLADRFAARFLGWIPRTIILSAFVLLTPLFELGLLGMEHTLHLYLVLGFLMLFSDAEQRPMRLAAITALMVATRYEGLFLVAAAALLLLCERRWRVVAWLLAGALLPVVAYGIFSVAHGAYFLPNPVALKGNHPHGLAAAIAIAKRFVDAPQVSLPMLALMVAAVGLWRSRPAGARAALLVAAAGLLHVAEAGVGSAFRYEAYLLGAATLLLGVAFTLSRSFRGWSWYAFLATAAMAFSVMLGRAQFAMESLPAYARTIYSQQWQMARFLATSFPHASVAANDIGLISFRTDIHCLDLVGLANSDVFRVKRAGQFTTSFLQNQAAANAVQLAMVYDFWFTGTGTFYTDGPALPGAWIRVAQLRTPYAANLGDSVVTFYAVDPAMAEPLRTALAKFQPTLPSQDQLTITR